MAQPPPESKETRESFPPVHLIELPGVSSAYAEEAPLNTFLHLEQWHARALWSDPSISYETFEQKQLPVIMELLESNPSGQFDYLNVHPFRHRYCGIIGEEPALACVEGDAMFKLAVFGFVALGFSFLCSIAEAVLLSVTPSYVALLEQEGRDSGRLLRQLNEDLGRPLAAILSLNTIAHTVGATGVGMQSAVVFGSASLGVVSAILTLLILVLSEIIPKTLGVVHWRTLAPPVARGVIVMIWLMYPLVWMSEILTKLISKREAADIFSREEFTAMVRLGVREGQIDEWESHIVRNLLRLPKLRVKEILTPRTVVFALPESMTIEQVFEENPEMPFSRIPIFENNHDDINGFVLKSDILLAQARDQHEARLYSLKREIRSIPETASLSNLFEFLLEKREHILLVVDEYGGIEGVVTLEDLIETLLGLEIVDETDETIDMRALARARWKKRGGGFGLLEDQPRSEPDGKR
jgi:CBS domain containing-hemolysin-like protein